MSIHFTSFHALPARRAQSRALTAVAEMMIILPHLLQSTNIGPLWPFYLVGGRNLAGRQDLNLSSSAFRVDVVYLDDNVGMPLFYTPST